MQSLFGASFSLEGAIKIEHFLFFRKEGSLSLDQIFSENASCVRYWQPLSVLENKSERLKIIAPPSGLNALYGMQDMWYTVRRATVIVSHDAVEWRLLYNNNLFFFSSAV